MNKAILIGRLGRDPEVKTLQNGDKVANLSLATSERWKDKHTGERKEKTEWHKITVWRGLAEVAEKYLNKGDQVMIEGKIETRKWQDQNGQDRYTTEIRGERLEMLGGAKGGDAREQPERQSSSADLDNEIPY